MNKRLFIAIDPPQEVREQLAALCCGLPDARWTPVEQLHLTLCFIGEVSGDHFLDIREALAELHVPPFPLQLRGVGFFPPRGLPRVVWAGGTWGATLPGRATVAPRTSRTTKVSSTVPW